MLYPPDNGICLAQAGIDLSKGLLQAAGLDLCLPGDDFVQGSYQVMSC